MIVGAAQAMLHDQGLPMHLWVEACNTAVYMKSRCPHRVHLKKLLLVRNRMFLTLIFLALREWCPPLHDPPPVADPHLEAHLWEQAVPPLHASVAPSQA